MINLKSLSIGLVLFLIGQILAWYQTNGQFISSWIKENPLLVALIGGIPVGYSYILGTTYIVSAFNGELWPSRLLGFAMGVVAFTFLAYAHLGETVTTKTLVTLLLAFAIVLIQVFWK
jgi:hypothetical protein|tara:strand:- start:1023 stop:1376 length:354 start_codon:yes stop_codon:yes gene_type:complete